LIPRPRPPSLRPQGAGSPAELRALLQALHAVRDGDFSVRLPGDWTGLHGKIADTFNEIVMSNARIASEIKRVGHVVGRQGQARQRVRFQQSSGAWGEMEGSVNTLIDDLLWPTTEVTRVVAAVAKGDLLQTVRLDVEGRPLEGEFLRSATIVNTMIEQLGVFTSEVTRVAREVGTDGKLGGQAEVRNVSGVWKDLTGSVNSMASNLTGQVRNISEVTIAVAEACPWITVDVAADPAAQGGHQHDGRPAALVRVGGHPRRAGVGTEAGSAARPWCPASPARGGSPTRSTRWRTI
jgi:methyl-accepting chemotaxis protein